MNKFFSKLAIITYTTAAAFMFTGCNEDTGPLTSGKSSEELKLNVNLRSKVAKVAHRGTARVSGDGIEDITSDLRVDGSLLYGEIAEVPVGEDRIVEISIFNKNDSLYFQSLDTVDVVGDVATVIEADFKTPEEIQKEKEQSTGTIVIIDTSSTLDSSDVIDLPGDTGAVDIDSSDIDSSDYVDTAGVDIELITYTKEIITEEVKTLVRERNAFYKLSVNYVDFINSGMIDQLYERFVGEKNTRENQRMLSKSLAFTYDDYLVATFGSDYNKNADTTLNDTVTGEVMPNAVVLEIFDEVCSSQQVSTEKVLETSYAREIVNTIWGIDQSRKVSKMVQIAIVRYMDVNGDKVITKEEQENAKVK